MSLVDDLKNKLTNGKDNGKAVKKKPAVKPSRLSTGSTLLNLALTGDPDWGLSNGCYYLLVGDSRSGKSFLSLQALAEASIHPAYGNHRFIYDAPERGARMGIERFFGSKLDKRLEWRYSATVEEFYYGVDDCFDKNKPFIYILDSESSLSSEDETEKFQSNKLAFRKGKEATGSYGDGKAKKHSSNLRQVITKLEKSESILIMVSQSRDNIGFGSQFNPKTRAGGKALTFYATAECWFSIKEQIKKQVLGKPRKVGSILQVKVTKNRETGREPVIELLHYPSHGFDEIGSVVNWLIDEGCWKKEGKAIVTDLTGSDGQPVKDSVDGIIETIQSSGLEGELKRIAHERWVAIEAASSIQRKLRYA